VLATIVSGKADLADVLFLIGVILAIVVAVLAYRPLDLTKVLLALALAAIAGGLLVL